MKDIDDLAHHASSLCQSVRIAYRHAHRWRHLCDHADIGICQSVPHLVHICMDTDCTCRTEYAALTAADTVCINDLFVKCRHDHCIRTAECKPERADSLKLFTGTHTVTAQNTLVRIANDRRRTVIDLVMLSRILKPHIKNTHAVCQKLKIALSALYARCTVSAVCGKQKLYDQFSVFLYFARICIDYHSVSRLLGA